MFETKEKIIETVVSKLPYANQIKNWDLSRKDEVRFDWKGDSFSINLMGTVTEVQGNLLGGSNICIVMKELFKQK